MCSIAHNLAELKRGGKPAFAQILSAIESDDANPALIHLLDCAHSAARAQVVGLTGPPGVGKSTLSAAMIRHFRKDKLSVAVIAVDPSSKISGGALLGDRIRLNADPDDDGVFIRSFSNQGRLGGVSRATYAAMVLMRACFDRVIIETVGVGQSENAIADIADTIVLCVQPGAGDNIQFMKSGIMELPHIIVVTKADLGAVARTACADVKAALDLQLKTKAAHPVSVVMVAAPTGQGLEAFMALVAQHFISLETAGDLAREHQAKSDTWIKDAILRRFGEDGWHRAQSYLAEYENLPGFSKKTAVIERLQRADFNR